MFPTNKMLHGKKWLLGLLIRNATAVLLAYVAANAWQGIFPTLTWISNVRDFLVWMVVILTFLQVPILLYLQREMNRL